MNAWREEDEQERKRAVGLAANHDGSGNSNRGFFFPRFRRRHTRRRTVDYPYLYHRGRTDVFYPVRFVGADRCQSRSRFLPKLCGKGFRAGNRFCCGMGLLDRHGSCHVQRSYRSIHSHTGMVPRPFPACSGKCHYHRGHTTKPSGGRSPQQAGKRACRRKAPGHPVLYWNCGAADFGVLSG